MNGDPFPQQPAGQQQADDPWLTEAQKQAPAPRRRRAAAPDQWLAEASKGAVAPADTVPSPSIIPNDTTEGPEGIRANDPDAIRRYLQEADALTRKAVARRDSLAAVPKPAPTPRPQRTPVAGRGISMTPEQERAGQERQQGFAEGAKNVALGVPRFLGSTVKGALSYTPEELRREDIRDYVRSQGKDPDQLLHEALRQRGRGESLGPIETGRAAAIGMGRMGYDLQREAQGGALWELGADRQGHLTDESPDMSTGERIRRVTELAGNAALFGAGAEEGSLDTRLNAGHQAIVDAAGRVKARLGGGRRPATPPSAITSAADAVPLPGVEAAQAAPPRTPRAEYEAQAGPVRTAPGAEELLRQPSADPFVEEAYAQQAKPRDIATMSADEAANEAAQLSLIAKKTPEQRARAEALNERARLEADKIPPPPPVEQSAYRGEEPPPITRDIVERERQRPELEASGRIPQPPQRAPYEERRAPGDRRYDETGLIDETEERRQAERRQPGTSRTGPERRDLGSRPPPQGGERRQEQGYVDAAGAYVPYEGGEERQAPPKEPRGYDPEPPTQTADLPAAPDELAAHEAARQPDTSSRERAAAAGQPYDFDPGNAQRLRDMQARKLAEQQAPTQPTTSIDLRALDARVEAQRAKNAKLQADQEAMPVKRLNATERIAERQRNRERAEGTRETMLRERAVMERQLQQVKDELASYPQKGRPRPALAERLKALKATISDYQTRIKELNNQIGERGAVPLGPVAPEVAAAAQRMLSPTTVSAEAEHAGRILRSNLGEAARNYEMAAEALKKLGKTTPHLNTPEGLKLSEDIETGQPVAPEYAPAAKALRTALDDARDQIRALGTGKLEHFITDYLGHIWENPDAPSLLQRLLGRRPLAGSKSFLKQRTVPTIADGMRAGLTPVTTNLVDMQLLKLREMHRYLMAERMLTELKDNKLIELVPGMHKPPTGYIRIADPITSVFGKPVVRNVGGKPVAVPVKLGEYWAPEPVARLLNNYLAPGLRGNAIFDVYRGVGNFLNQVQLGFGAFHLGFTTLDVAVSKAALGIEQLASGSPLKAAGSFAAVPASPLTNYLQGTKLYREYLRPGTQGGDFMALADHVASAGGRVRMDSFYKNSSVEKFFDAWHKRRPLSAAKHSIPALVEAVSKPIMEHIVPRQKLGVFADLARHELERLGPNVTADATRAAMQRAWDSVDNRMGQLVYDNLFWNRAVKDLGMASVRSLGWNIGTVREVGGGLADLLRGKGPAASHRAAYVVALPIVVGLYGGILNYLFTGEAPQKLKDWYFPRTGHKNDDGTEERVQLPSYMRDITHVARGGAWQMAKNKIHPLLQVTADMLNNEDFYGNLIRNPDDPAVKQAQQEVDYALKQFEPFTIQYARREREQGQGPAAVAGQFVGITPAPREVVRTPAMNKMHEYLLRRGAQLTPEQVEEREQLRPVRRSLRQGDWGPFSQALGDQRITSLQAKDMARQSFNDPIVNSFEGLTLEEAERVWQAASPQERTTLEPYYLRKIHNSGQSGHLDEVMKALELWRTQHR